MVLRISEAGYAILPGGRQTRLLPGNHSFDFVGVPALTGSLANARYVAFADAVTGEKSGLPHSFSGLFATTDSTDPSLDPLYRARLAAIVESSDDAIVSKTLDGVIRSWNAGAERIFGYTAAEAVGQSITLIIPPERLDEERMILAKLVLGERVDHFETVRMAKDGRRLDISVTVSPIRDVDGRVVGASKVARDITGGSGPRRPCGWPRSGSAPCSSRWTKGTASSSSSTGRTGR